MAAATATAMDALDIAGFLADQQTGVLAMATDGGVYALPVAFAFDEDGPNFYFRLGYAAGSQKRAFVEAADEVTFVVYDLTDEGWKSVVAEGRLEPGAGSDLDGAVLQAVERLRIPSFPVHRRPPGELEFEVVRLDIDKLSGVAERRQLA